MTKIVCITINYAFYTFERALEGISRAGYKYCAIGHPHQKKDIFPPSIPTDEAIDQYKSLLDKYNLEPAMLMAHHQFHANKPIEEAVRRLHIAKAFGIDIVSTLSFWGYHNYPDKPLSAEEFAEEDRNYIAFMKEVAQEAESLGITITVKPHTGNTATAPMLKDTLERIGSTHVKAAYDPANVSFYEGLAPEDDFHLVAPLSAAFFAKDHGIGEQRLRSYDFPIPGEGDIDFLSMFKTLHKHDFDGPIFVEKCDGKGSLTGGNTPLPPEEIDQRVERARINLERLAQEAGLTLS